jgi:hypothetical protein
MFDGKIIGETKKSKKTLPYFFPPPIKTYLNIASFSSMILSNPKNLDWFHSLFFQIRINFDSSHAISFFPKDIERHSCNLLSHFCLQDKLLDIEEDELVGKITSWIDKDYYVKIDLDESLFAETRVKESKLHLFNIIGYDLDRKVFLIMNFDKKHNLSIIEISFGDLIKAFASESTKNLLKKSSIKNIQDDSSGFLIRLYKLNNSFQFNLNKNIIKNQFELYLKSENMYFNSYYYQYEKEEGGIWGINVTKEISNFLENNSDIKNMDYRVAHGLYEHKMLMYEKIKHFEKRNIIDSNNNYSKLYCPVVSEAQKIRYNCMEFNFSQKSSLIKDSIERLQFIFELEEKIISRVRDKI